jgi:hypothetical protein
MPSGHYGHLRQLRLLSYWTYNNMPSSHLGYLRHFSHLGHLSYLGNIGNLNTLAPYPLDSALTDSPLEAFITELDPKDLGPPEGYYKDDLLDPLPTDTPLLLTPSPLGRTHIRQIDAWMGMTRLDSLV